MMAGALNELVEIYNPTYSANTFGERIQTFNKVFSTRAEVVHNGGSRANENGEIILTQGQTFRMRIYVPITDYSRIKWDGNFYQVTNIERDKRLQMLTVTTDKINE